MMCDLSNFTTVKWTTLFARLIISLNIITRVFVGRPEQFCEGAHTQRVLLLQFHVIVFH